MVERLKASGFIPAAERDGHLKLAKRSQVGDRVVVVPAVAGGAELAVGTLRAILQQAGIEREEFDGLAAVKDAVQ